MKTEGIVFEAEVSVDLEPGVVTLYDMSRYGNNGAFGGGVNNPIWARLPSGLWVLSLNGSNDWINMGTNPSLNPTIALTAEIWTYILAHKLNVMFHKYVWVNNAWAIYSDAAGNIYVQLNNNAGGVWESALEAITTAEWHHVVATIDYVNSITTLYLDGVLVSFDNTPNGVIEPANNVGGLYLGRPTSSHSGYLALPRAYYCLWTAGQVLQRYEATRRFFP